MIIKGITEKSLKIGDAIIFYKEPSLFKITKEVYEFTGLVGFDAFEKLSDVSMEFCIHFLKQIITRWENVVDEENNPISYQPEYLESLDGKELSQLLNFLKNLIDSKLTEKREGDAEVKNS